MAKKIVTLYIDDASLRLLVTHGRQIKKCADLPLALGSTKVSGAVKEAEVAIEKWVKTYNYERTHQGLGGLLVPADRFHGRVDEVLKSMSEGLDPKAETCYVMEGISRSLINLVIAPGGRMTLYLLGQPLTLFGGCHE